ncbi:MAG: GtrA family protein [Candidatus Gastranaerophilaceae bacterium]
MKNNSKILDIYYKWCELPDTVRFLLIGGVNAAFSYVIFAIAVHMLGQEFYQLCVALQWIISSVFSFVNQKLFVFCTKGNWLKEYFKCCTTWVVSYCCNALILEVIVRYITKNVYVGQIFSIFFASMVTYVLFKYFAFRHREVN